MWFLGEMAKQQLYQGQNRNHLAWLDIGDDLVNQVDGDDPEDTEDHDVWGDDRVQEVDADDQDPVVRSGEK